MTDRLSILFLLHIAPSPASSGVQRRIEGLMTALSRRHSLSCVSLIWPDLDVVEAQRAMAGYCEDAHFVVAPPWQGFGKRLSQLRSLASRRSFETRVLAVPAFPREVRRALESRPFDVVCVETPFLSSDNLTVAGRPAPLRILDEHNIEADLAKQQADTSNPVRRLHHAVNWRKIRREELRALRTFDGVAFCSEADQVRAREIVPGLRSAVVPNGVNLEYFKPDPSYPKPDGRTIVFFGAINYFPNVDGLRFFVHDVWPLLAASHPNARLKIVGKHPTPEILGFRSERIDVVGQVDDLRPVLAAAAATVVPLRIGGGTRLKILEAMGMARPVVSTSRGAEGIEAKPERDILIGDDAAALAAQVRRVLDDAAFGERLGQGGRRLVEERYSWNASAERLEGLIESLRDGGARGIPRPVASG